MKNNYTSVSDEETQKIGEEFSRELKKGDIVLLYGDLGFGKTTFAKGIARGLGVKTRIISPTFPIIRSHKNIHHIDLYRIENAVDLQGVGLQEILEDATAIKLIEWPEKLSTLPKKRWDVFFKMSNGNIRTISLNKHG